MSNHRTFADDGRGGSGAGDFPGYGTADLPVGPTTGGVVANVARSDHQHPILTVNTRTGMTALVTATMPMGTPCYLIPRDATYILATSALTVDNVRVVASDNPSRQWLRRVAYSAKWSQEIDWAVNTATGNDDNTGRTGSPLKTMDECVCRTWQAVYPIGTNACTVKLTGDMTATDSGHFNVRGNGSFPFTADSPLGYDTAFQIIGQPVSLGFAGVMSAVQNGALGSLLDIHFTDVGIPVSFTASGFMAKNLIYKRTTAPAAYFWPVKDLGAKTLRCSQLNQAGTFAAYPAIANTNTYDIMTLPSIHDVDFPVSNADFADYQIALCYDTTDVVSAPTTCPITRYGYSYANAQQVGGGFYNCQLPSGTTLGAPETGTQGQVVSGCVHGAAATTNGRLTIGLGAVFGLSAEGSDFVTFQGCQLIADVHSQCQRAQIMFFDATVALIQVLGQSAVNLIQIGGAGNTNKIFNSSIDTAITYDNLPNAGMTSDVQPYRALAASQSTPLSVPGGLLYQGPTTTIGNAFESISNGVVALALGATGPAGLPANPVRYLKIPDGAGGFFTIPSWT